MLSSKLLQLSFRKTRLKQRFKNLTRLHCKLFHNLSAASKNAQSPLGFKHIIGTDSNKVFKDLTGLMVGQKIRLLHKQKCRKLNSELKRKPMQAHPNSRATFPLSNPLKNTPAIWTLNKSSINVTGRTFVLNFKRSSENPDRFRGVLGSCDLWDHQKPNLVPL